MMNKICPICHTEFYIKPNEIKRRKCCSKKCAGMFHSKHIMGINNPNHGEKTIILICYRCGKIFIRKLRIYKKTEKYHLNKNGSYNTFCSQSCAGKYYGKIIPKHGEENNKFGKGNLIRGDRNPNWRGGRTLTVKKFRHSNDYQIWRKAVIERDNVCIQCGSSEKLHADHIKPVILNPTMMFDVNNGRILCQKCHLKTDTYGSKVMMQYRRLQQGLQPSYIL